MNNKISNTDKFIIKQLDIREKKTYTRQDRNWLSKAEGLIYNSFLVFLVIVTVVFLIVLFGSHDLVDNNHPTVKGTHDLESFVMNNCDEETKEIWKQVAWYAEYSGIEPSVIFAIGWADSSCGTNMTTANNPGNVGNDDSGNRQGFHNMFSGWKAIVDTLNNQYIGKVEKIGHLSQGGRNNMIVERSCRSAIRGYSCYASSEENWNFNVINVLREIHQNDLIDENWEFRKN